ncbi:MAG: universal stress protein [Alphaproteobacteria bacterium]|nr:universal stress protein [Alphaproteobacteria bacterium]
MARMILASLSGLSSDHTVLDTAIAAAHIDGGHVLALRTRIDVVDVAAAASIGLPRPGLGISDSIVRIREEERVRARHARGAYDEARSRHGIDAGSPVTLAWEETASLSDTLLARARYHDLTVMGRDEELSPERIRTVLLTSGRPLLLAPPRAPSLLGKTVAIAWKEGAEAARAITAAEPLLARAERIFILAAPDRSGAQDQTAGSVARLAEHLTGKGFKTEIRLTEPGGGPHAIRNLAYECDADLLVMGAYAHSRVREMLLGGMTEAMLADCAIPVFLFH